MFLMLGARPLDQRLDSPGPQPEGMASDGVHLWVADFQTSMIYRLDPENPLDVVAFPAPDPQPEGLAWDGTHLWAASWSSRKIRRLQVGEGTFTVDRELPTPRGARPVGLTWDGEALWLTTWIPFWLYRLDPQTGEVLYEREIQSPAPRLYPATLPSPEDLAWDGEALWITDWYTGAIYRIDPQAEDPVLRTVPTPGRRSVGLTFHRGVLWNGDTEARALFRLDAVPVESSSWGGLKLRGGRRSPKILPR